MLSSSQIDFAAANLSESIKQPATAAFQPSVMMDHLWPTVSTHHLSPLYASQHLQPVPQFSSPPQGTNTTASSSSSTLYSDAAKHLTHHGFATNTSMDQFHHGPQSFSSIAAGESLFSHPAAMGQTSRQLPSTLHSMLGGVAAAHSSTAFYSPYINNSAHHQWAPPTVAGNGGGRTTTLPSHPPSSTSTSALNAFSALGFHHCPPAVSVGSNGLFQSSAGTSFNQLSMAASGGAGGRGGGASNQLIDLSHHVVSRRLSLSLAGGSGLSLPVKMAGDSDMITGLADGRGLTQANPMQLPTRLNVAYIPLESPKRDHSSSSGINSTKSAKSDRHPHLSSHHQQHLQHEHKQPEVTCQVCHQAASNGLHFGARTCAACAAFFRRSISDQKRYVCKRSQRCVIRPGEVQGYRKLCRSCRMKRCMEIGMLPENVQNKRHRRELYYSSLANSNFLLEGGALSDAVHPPPQLSDQPLASVPEQPQQVPTPAAHYEFHPQQQPPTGLTIPSALSNLSLIHQLQQQQQQSNNT